MRTTTSVIKLLLIAFIIIITSVLMGVFVFRVRVFNNSVFDAKEFFNADNFLNRRYFRIKIDDIGYDPNNSRSGEETENNSKSNRYIHNRNIQVYKKEDVVRCLDSLSMERNRRPMHIAFVGDSTVRQHFLSFLRFIPDYDRKTASISTTFAEYAFHEDMNVTSRLLDNLRVSFYWRNLIRSDLIADFRRWASNDNGTQAPDFILLGITAHHLIVNNSVTSSLEMYEKLMEDELVPLLKQSLTTHPHQEIIWLRQSLTIEQLSPHENQVAYGIYPDKIQKYNAILPRVFK
ncbi:N-acetylneuraminate 9-O-acetyltransferase-like isoform X3 [Daphnia pulicaria]|nr:N-acetylneuraminate 9-O-acetyltransferase-like isoform X3 [Daphnia pulicaria]